MWTKWGRRRNFFIKKDVQGRYIFTTFLLVIFSCLLYIYIYSRLAADTLTISYKNSVLDITRTPIMVAREMLMANWIFIVTGGFFISFLTMFITHRFAGPLHRFEMALGEMIGGNHSTVIRLRNHDEGRELAAMINQYNDKVSDEIRALRETTLDIRESLDAAAASTDHAEVRARVSEAVRLAESLHERLGEYTIKNAS